MSFFAWCVASVRAGSGYTYFLLILSGIIQGCPLSGTLFAHCSHPLMTFIEYCLIHSGSQYDEKLFPGHSLAQACADDIGTVVAAMPMLTALAQPFAVMEVASGLTLEPPKLPFLVSRLKSFRKKMPMTQKTSGLSAMRTRTPMKSMSTSTKRILSTHQPPSVIENCLKAMVLRESTRSSLSHTRRKYSSSASPKLVLSNRQLRIRLSAIL